jgi:hypothetical protein
MTRVASAEGAHQPAAPPGEGEGRTALPDTIVVEIRPDHVELGVDEARREIGPLWLALEEAGYTVRALLATEARLERGGQVAWYTLDAAGYQLMAAGFRGQEPLHPGKVVLTRKLSHLQGDAP